MEWREELGVTEEEILGTTKKMASRNVAPGLDGVLGRIWAETMAIMAPTLRHLFTRCLREGVYIPSDMARLVLLRKEGRPTDSPSAYCPVCLLDEVGKLFERAIAARLEAHMSKQVPGWHESQYGFRWGGSTMDAVNRVREMSRAMVSRGGVALAVSLDIVNAFNTIPWDAGPWIFQCLPTSFVSYGPIWTTDGSTTLGRTEKSGGPLNAEFRRARYWVRFCESLDDVVLRCPMPPDSGIVCYADDKLVLAEGCWWYETLRHRELAAHDTDYTTAGPEEVPSRVEGHMVSWLPT